MVRLRHSPTQIQAGWLPSPNLKSRGDDCLVHQASSSPWAVANDPLNLLAVDSSTNRSKGDGGAATALCNDGTYSFAAHHQGACSRHGGVRVFYK